MAKILIENVLRITKPVKDYSDPFRFNLSVFFEDTAGMQHGFEIVGCVGGVGKDGKPEWRGPGFMYGRKFMYNVILSADTYLTVLRALVNKGIFSRGLELHQELQERQRAREAWAAEAAKAQESEKIAPDFEIE